MFNLKYRNFTISTWLVLILLLSGCGGGGSSPANVTGVTNSVDAGTGGAGTTPDTTTLALTIDSTSPPTYEWGTLASGENVYVDRSFTFTSIPDAYIGLKYLRTPNDDKTASGTSAVNFNVNQPVTVFVAYDPQFSTVPTWLESWTDTGDKWGASHLTFDVYSKDFPAGVVNLGGNELGGSMYSVAIMLQGGSTIGDPLTIGGNPPTSITEGTAYSFIASASGGNGSRTFSITNKPSWASFNTSIGGLSGTPGIGDIGTSSGIVISVSDGQSNISLAAFSVTVIGSSTGVATLSWTAPTQNADNTPLTDLAGYKIYYGTSVGNYPNSVRISNSGVTSGMVENLAPGTWNFVVAAYDFSGNESGFSNVASKIISAP